MKPVEGHPGWYRKNNGDIVNTNHEQIEKSRKLKKKRLEESKRLDNLETSVNELKNMMEVIIGKLS